MTDSSASAFSASEASPDDPAEGRPDLGATDVHLWLCHGNQVSNSDDFKRRVLSRYASVAPADWQFTLSPHGKPLLVTQTCALDINLSHSGDWLACAVTAGTPVGVDIEYCGSERDVMKLARRFFREEEVVALQSGSTASQRDRFYDYWTLKEAAVKARGEALAPGLQLRAFSLCFPRRRNNRNGRISVSTSEGPDEAYYCLLDPLAGYRMAICWLSVSPRPRLRMFELGEAEALTERSVQLRACSWAIELPMGTIPAISC